MARKSKDAEEFYKLKEAGLGFSSTDNTYQPDSGSTTGGRIGIQEYGLIGEVATEDLFDDSLADIEDPDGVDADAQLASIGGLNGEFAGTSEYSATHALDPEDIVENAETVSNQLEDRNMRRNNLTLLKGKQ